MESPRGRPRDQRCEWLWPFYWLWKPHKIVFPFYFGLGTSVLTINSSRYVWFQTFPWKITPVPPRGEVSPAEGESRAPCDRSCILLPSRWRTGQTQVTVVATGLWKQMLGSIKVERKINLGKPKFSLSSKEEEGRRGRGGKEHLRGDLPGDSESSLSSLAVCFFSRLLSPRSWGSGMFLFLV